MRRVPGPLSVSLMHPNERGLEDLEDEEDDVDDLLGTVEVLLDRSLQIRSVKNATLLLTADCTSSAAAAALLSLMMRCHKILPRWVKENFS